MKTSIGFGQVMRGGYAPPRLGRVRGADWKFALYVASIEIGAGILSLPVIAAKVGFVPAVALTLLLGLLLGAIYVRIARALHDFVAVQVQRLFADAKPVLERAGIHLNDESHQDELIAHLAATKQMGLLDDMTVWLGLENAGKFALCTGLACYVLPATVGYVAVGGRTLDAFARMLVQFGAPSYLSGLVGLASIAASFVVERVRPFTGRGALCSMLQMLGGWALAVDVLMIIPVGPAAGSLLFAAGGASIVLHRVQDGKQGLAHSGLEPVHAIGVAIVAIELILLGGTGAFAAVLLANEGGLATPLMVTQTSPALLATAFGVLLFSFVGTGCFNLLRYPSLFERGHGRLAQVVAMGTVIPGLAYLGWMFVISWSLPAKVLVAADRAGAYPTIPLGEKLAPLGWTGQVVVGVGYLVALLAVTGASTGFSESLGERLARVKNALRGGTTSAAPSAEDVRFAQLLVLAIATACAVALAVTENAGGDQVVSFTDLLKVAGNTGGGLLFLILPFFLPTQSRRLPRKWEVAVTALLMPLLMVVNVTVVPPDGAPGRTVVAVAVWLMNAALAAAGAWLVFSEPAESTEARVPTELNQASGVPGRSNREANAGRTAVPEEEVWLLGLS